MRELSEIERAVLQGLRAAGLPLIADNAESQWQQGRGWYIDQRVGVLPELRMAFKRANEIATANRRGK